MRAVRLRGRGAIVARPGVDVVQADVAVLLEAEAEVRVVREARAHVGIGKVVPAARARRRAAGDPTDPSGPTRRETCRSFGDVDVDAQRFADAGHARDHRRVVAARVVLAHAAVAIGERAHVDFDVRAAPEVRLERDERRR